MGDQTAWFCDSTLGERFPAWTRANAADVFPEPFSPLGLSLIIRGGMCLGLRDAYIAIGALDWDEYEEPVRPELWKVFGGYLYNPLTMTRILGARMPGASPELIDRAFFDDRDEVPPYEHQDWHDSPVHEARLARSMEWAMTTRELPGLDADKQLAQQLRDSRPDLGALTDSALHARARSMVPFVQQTFENAMIVSALSSLGTGALGAICEELGDPTLAIRLLAGIEVDSAAPTHAMWALSRLARRSAAVTTAFERDREAVLEILAKSDDPSAAEFLIGFERFLHDHGSRGPNEYDVRAPSWEARPGTALVAIDLMRRSDDSQAPAVRSATAVAERDRVIADICSRLTEAGESTAAFEAALASAQLFLAGRERAKTNVVRVINEARMALYEYGRRLVERHVVDDLEALFMVTDTELDELRADPQSLRGAIDQRGMQYRALFECEPVFVVNGRVPAMSEMTRRESRSVEAVSAGTVLTGAAGSGGSATGRARIVVDPSDPAGLEPGDVLVAPQTDPAWVPLMVAASAVVVNNGAQGSHAMIVSRELGIPCVVSVPDATSIIEDGATIIVDGTAGTVTIC